MILLICGKPGSGKTTLIKKVIRKSDRDWGGFYTQELREHNTRVGFQIITLSGQKGILAHQDLKSMCKVGKYYVNLDDLDNIGVASIESGLIENKSIIIDEIGKMEIQSDKFKKIVSLAVKLSPLIIATISDHDDAFIKSFKRLDNAMLIEVTEENRDLLDKMILNLIK